MFGAMLLLYKELQVGTSFILAPNGQLPVNPAHLKSRASKNNLHTANDVLKFQSLSHSTLIRS